MKKKLLYLLLTQFTLCISSQSYFEIFNSSISKNELIKLEQGEILVRNIGNKTKLCLTQSNNFYVNLLQEQISSLKPNYLAEIIKIVPKKLNSNLYEEIYNLILDVESYTNIPYFSEQQQKWYKLYDSVEINLLEKKENFINMDLTVLMIPFDFININGKLEKNNNTIYFTMINNSPIIYTDKKITCIKPENMLCSIVIFEYRDYYILYGIGAVKAPSIFFLRDRIDTAFIGRIKHFCKYMFK